MCINPAESFIVLKIDKQVRSMIEVQDSPKQQKTPNFANSLDIKGIHSVTLPLALYKPLKLYSRANNHSMIKLDQVPSKLSEPKLFTRAASAINMTKFASTGLSKVNSQIIGDTSPSPRSFKKSLSPSKNRSSNLSPSEIVESPMLTRYQAPHRASRTQFVSGKMHLDLEFEQATIDNVNPLSLKSYLS
jgi:hypothetical protein